MLLKLIALGCVLYYIFKFWRPATLPQNKKTRESKIQEEEEIIIRRTDPKKDKGDYTDYEEV